MGEIAEQNALSMHATMWSAWPPLTYATPETVAAMHKVWDLRKQGIPVYFTQDAGPNLKLIFEKETAQTLTNAFPGLQIIETFPAP